MNENWAWVSLVSVCSAAAIFGCGGADNPRPFGAVPPNTGGLTVSGALGGVSSQESGGMTGALGTGATSAFGGTASQGGGGASGAVEVSGGTTAGGAGGSGFPMDGGSRVGIDGSSAGPAPVMYPPLEFSAIGTPVQISGQFLFTEGPIWDPAKGVLYFTDINANAVYQLTLPNRFDVLLQPAQYADGLALDAQGNLIGAGFSARDIWRLSSGTMETIAVNYQGMKLNSPDDLISRSDGVLFFTDPTFGINGSQGLPSQAPELSFQGVYRVTTDGVLYVEDETTSAPNGVELSPDEQLLYVSYTSTGEVYTFAVASDGALSRKTLFANGVTIADSMCVDAGGNLYVASLSGIVVFRPDGTRLGTIAVGQIPTNAAFGGPDQTTLFITARRSLIGTPAAGNSGLYRIDHMPIPGIPGKP